MIDLLRTTWILFHTHLLRAVRGRRLLMMLGLATVPAGLMTVVLASGRFFLPTLIADVTWDLALQVVLPLITLIAGAAVVEEEISERTLTFVFTRPVSRVGFLLGRLGATWVTVSVVLALSVQLIFTVWAIAGRTTPPGMYGAVMTTMLVGGLVYTALFAVMGAWFKHPTIVGLAYVFAVEALVANLPGSSQDLAIQYHLRSCLVGSGGPVWAPLADRGVGIVYAPGPEAMTTLLQILGAFLVLGALVIRRRQYVMPS